MIIDEDDYLSHYGTPRHSGRYPWGSSGWGDPNKRNKELPDYIAIMKKEGLSESQIAKGLGISTTKLRALNSIARNYQKQQQIDMALRLKDKGYSNVAAAKRMDIPESTFRTLIAPGAKDRADNLTSIANTLKELVSEKKVVDGKVVVEPLDIGSGVESQIGVSQDKLRTATAILEEEGYQVHTLTNPQIGTGLDTRVKVLVPPDTTWGEAQSNLLNLKQIQAFSEDDGRTFGNKVPHAPIGIDPKRLDVRFAEDGGAEADGVIFVRPGVKDIAIGENRYAQVRVKVGDDKYLKGMAVYKDDLPPGTDLVFNTNKNRTPNKLDALKNLESDPYLPFGSVTRPILENVGTPEERPTSAMNLVNEEGDWKNWNKTLSSQMLSKQKPSLVKSQLDITYKRRQEEFDEIMSLTNPTVKKVLLDKFAESSDAAAVHLKAAGMDRQAWQVILPVNSIKENEIYAPNFRDGEQVALIRYPHGGIFEIPELTVNNKQPEARKLLGTEAKDAVGIHHKVAQHLSGADFDGDTVLVIPNPPHSRKRIQTSPPLEGLKDFDPERAFPGYEGMPKLTPVRKQQLMGDVSNLITDMTLKGASHEELARAVKHSMVVIDAEKKNLNHKESARQNNIKNLKEKYQGGPRAGASTIVSRKGSEDVVPERKLRPHADGGPVDLKTGRLVYVETGATRRTRSGEVVPKTSRVNRLADTPDAHTQSSGTRTESLYADHSNRLKELANRARLESIKTPPLKYSPSAKRAYETEVASLDSKLALIKRNRPLERQAQVVARQNVRARREANPHLDGDTLKKIEFQALTDARNRLGAQPNKVTFTPREWEAVQAGAITDNKLGELLQKADMDNVRSLATPRTRTLMTPAKVSQAQAMFASGYTRAQVADRLGVGLTTLDESIQQGGS